MKDIFARRHARTVSTKGLLSCGKPPCLACLILAAAMVGNAQAHRMDHAVSQDEAMVVSLAYAYGHPPAYETYRVYAPGLDVAFQHGRTDALGRLSFLPDRPGTWRAVVSTDDGHGVDIGINIDEAMTVAEITAPGHTHWALVLAGVGYLFGLAGLLVLWRNRKSKAGTN